MQRERESPWCGSRWPRGRRGGHLAEPGDVLRARGHPKPPAPKERPQPRQFRAAHGPTPGVAPNRRLWPSSPCHTLAGSPHSVVVRGRTAAREKGNRLRMRAVDDTGVGRLGQLRDCWGGLALPYQLQTAQDGKDMNSAVRQLSPASSRARSSAAGGSRRAVALADVRARQNGGFARIEGPRVHPWQYN